VTVEVRVNICITGGVDCYALGVPKATIEIRQSGGAVVATESTDDDGIAELDIPEGFVSGNIVAQSPLLEGGKATTVFSNPSAGGDTITLLGNLFSGVNAQ
jgi:hypothetical protein